MFEFGWLQRIWLLERIAERAEEMRLNLAYDFAARKLWRAHSGSNTPYDYMT